MRQNSAIIYGTLLCGLIMSAAPVSATKLCELPSGLGKEITKKYPEFRIVNRKDLSAYDEQLFEKDHANTCPGLVQVDFYGDGKPTWAILLLQPTNRRTDLVLAHYSEIWKFQMLDSVDAAPVPAVWSEKPGKYDEVYGHKTVRATRPVIILCGYESWAILYPWIGDKVEKIWISD